MRFLYLKFQEDPEKKAIKKEISKIIAQEISKLPLEKKDYYFILFLPLRDIVIELNKSKSRISQIHSKVIKQLRLRLICRLS